ncbi:MAG: GFA family protein [Rhodobacteraceae bacterium]|nr:GFA family protein [Paracoccaceae bacterium]
MHKGSCLCGNVTFTVTGDLSAPDACHCTMCRKVSGHYTSGTGVLRDRLHVKGSKNITWYRSSNRARQGFCTTCGSSLFFDPVTGTDWISVSMGAFDTPTGTKICEHIFTADKGDYYTIADDLPQYAQFSGAERE